MEGPVTYLTDCTDTNAVARLGTRISTLFGGLPLILPLNVSRPDLAAGLTLIDLIAATKLTGQSDKGSIILINIAPRDGVAHNGAPFCYFYHRKHLVVTTTTPEVLGIARLHLGCTEVNVTDIREVMHAAARSWASFTEEEIELVANNQFRSLWFLPLLAKWIDEDRQVPSGVVHVPDSPVYPCVAMIDNFGNCKINYTMKELGGSVGSYLKVCTGKKGSMAAREIRCYQRLADVPRGQAAVVVGSSGPGFAELVVNGGSAAAEFDLNPGDTLF